MSLENQSYIDGLQESNDGQELLDFSQACVDAIYKKLDIESVNPSLALDPNNPNLQQLIKFVEENKDSLAQVEKAEIVKTEKEIIIRFPTESQLPKLTLKEGEAAYEGLLYPIIEKENRRREAMLEAKRNRDKLPQKAATRQELRTVETDLSKKILTFQETVENKKEQDLATIRSTKLKDIVTKRGILTKKDLEDIKDPKEVVKILKEETARLLNIYTTTTNDGWYRLNYQGVGGMKHEMNVGLGDILVDEDIKIIEILHQGETTPIRAVRGFSSKGKPGFIDENGEYIATYTGDKFKILNESTNKGTKLDNKKDLESYVNSYKKTQAKLSSFSGSIKREGLQRKINFNPNYEITNEEIANARPTSEATIISQLSGQLEETEAIKVLEYAKEACQRFGIPFSIYKELVYKESKWLPRNPNPISSANGLGQFIDSSWEGFVKTANRNGWYEESWGKKPLGHSHKTNPYANAFATAWLISQTYEKMSRANIDLATLPIEDQAITVYLAHHEGFGAVDNYKNFLDKMLSENHNSLSEMASAYNRDPEKYNKILSGAQVKRIRKRGIKVFLSIYFKFAKKIAINAAASTPERLEIAKSKTKSKEEIRNAMESDEKTSFSLNNNQDTWIFGSSIANGVDTQVNHKRAGVYGIRGMNSKRFASILANNINQIKQFKKPKKIVLLGLVHNDVAGNTPSRKIVEQHLELVNYIKKELGVENVQIASAHPWEKKSDEIKEFNRIIAEEHSDIFADCGSKSSKLHPGPAEYAKMAEALS